MKKNVLITGASGNLGKATVKKFLSEGYTVLATVTPGKPKFETADTLYCYETDLADENSVARTIQEIIAKHHTLHAALLLAGGFSQGTILTTDGASIRKMFTLNFDTAYYIARLVLQQMLTQATGGRIVFIGSRPALQASEGRNAVAYALSKSLLFKLSEIINAEGAKKNVVSSVIVPGILDTPVNRSSMPQANFSNWVRPEEIAEVMAFIIGEQGGALRDTVLKIYGGSE